MGYPSYPEHETEDRQRADAAEADLYDVRAELRDYIQWLTSPDRGPVIFRSEVVERLSQILAP